MKDLSHGSESRAKTRRREKESLCKDADERRFSQIKKILTRSLPAFGSARGDQGHEAHKGGDKKLLFGFNSGPEAFLCGFV
jgi:hypothetical protein